MRSVRLAYGPLRKALHWLLARYRRHMEPVTRGHAPRGYPPSFCTNRGRSSEGADFQRQIDEVRVWTVPRSAEQIRHAMFQRLTGL